MVQFIPARNDWADAFKSIGKGVSEGYTNRTDENAIQNAIAGLGENASAKDILNAITNTKTYSPKAKQQVLENYLGVEKFEETKRIAKEQNELLKARNQIALGKEGNRAAENDQKRAATQSVVNQLEGLDETQKEELGKSLTLNDATGLLKEQFKSKNKPSDIDKRLREKTIDEYIDLTQEIESLSKTNELIEDVEKDVAEMEKSPLSSYAAGKIGTKWATQLEAKSLPIIQPTLKLLAPSGPIIKAKLELAKDLLHIKATDFPWQARGKIEAAKTLNKLALTRAKDRKDVIEQADFNPRNQRVLDFDNETAGMVDAVLDLDFAGKELTPKQVQDLKLPSPAKRKGRPPIRAPDGTRYISNGEKWIVM